MAIQRTMVLSVAVVRAMPMTARALAMARLIFAWSGVAVTSAAGSDLTCRLAVAVVVSWSPAVTVPSAMDSCTADGHQMATFAPDAASCAATPTYAGSANELALATVPEPGGAT